MEENSYVISVLFTQYNDFFSKIVSLLSGREYSHVSISLHPEENTFFAFNTKGFRKEFPERYSKRIIKCTCYHLEITRTQYDVLSLILNSFIYSTIKAKYNWFGLIFAFLNIPLKMKNRYFCSQFVTNILDLAEIIHWDKNPNSYLPNQIHKELLKTNLITKTIPNPFLRAKEVAL